MHTLPPGAVVDGRFELHAVIGVGGFASVFRGFDRQTEREVAVKLLRPESWARPQRVERFHREAEICAQLAHPNTARLLHFGEGTVGRGAAPAPYMVFELVRGLALDEILATRGHTSLAEAVRVTGAVLDSLEEAHAHGILHRDIKPENVLVVAPASTWRDPYPRDSAAGALGIPPEGDPLWADLAALDVKLCDFGVALLLAGSATRLTASHRVVGTAYYMSPEQAMKKPSVDHRSDIYGVAMLLHHMLVGAPPFGERSQLDAAWAHVTEPIPPLAAPHHNAPIAAVYARAAAKDKANRFTTAGEMARALRGVLG